MSQKKVANPAPFINVGGLVYRLANQQVSVDEVKESINKAADKAAIENIAVNLASHAQDVQDLASSTMDIIDDKAGAQKHIDEIKAHIEVMVKFLQQLQPKYNQYTKKHPAAKKPSPPKPEPPVAEDLPPVE